MTDMLTHRAPSAPLPAPETAWSPLTWDDDFEEPLVCTQRMPVTHDVTSFVLEPRRPRLFSFQPGQYLTFTLTIEGAEIRRCYTISSPATRPDQLAITVKRVPGGPVSNWLHDRFRVGDALVASGPYGAFTTSAHPSARQLFLSAGSGITPLMSMVRTMVDLRQPVDVMFVHSARTPDDIVFRRELEAVAAEHPGIAVVTVCEDDSPGERWSGPRGRLSAPLLRQIAPDAGQREVFTCGPPPYMAAVRDILAEVGADPRRCHEESFSFDEPVRGGLAAEPPPEDGVETPTRFCVELARSGRTFECDATSTVLEAAADAGVQLPSSCGEGVCGTCKTSLVSGRVEMNHAGGIRRREIDQNKVLLCCSTPLEDLVVDA